MNFTADVYRTAAEEHVNAARQLYTMERYVLAHYVAGLAVECLFRAYKSRRNPAAPFDEHHGLHELAEAGRFYDLVPEKLAEIRAALGDVVTRWLNNHRYRSEGALRAFLKEKKLDRGLPRGTDVLKENSRRIVNAALQLVRLGVSQWGSQSS